MTLQVAYTGEFHRVASLPRRTWSEPALLALAGEMTSLLRAPGGTMTLLPVQALAIHDAATQRGLLCGAGVGEGKTLMTMLIPVVLRAERPLLLVPASTIEKTMREREALAAHFGLRTSLRVLSYQLLGRVQAEHELDAMRPDLILADEVQKLRNKDAAVTRRVLRYMHRNPNTVFCGFSGTVMEDSILDFAHLLVMALKENAPVPITVHEQVEWAEALDRRDEYGAARAPGALLELAHPEDRDGGGDDRVTARRAFRRRLLETPGVVSTVGEGESCNASLYVRGVEHKVSRQTEAWFVKLRGDGTPQNPGWLVPPDDWPLTSPTDVWRHAQELALGLNYRWDPRPPDDWRAARAAWGKFVRKTVSRGRTYDSDEHVANAVDAGKLPEGAAVLARWRELRPTFEPNVTAVWHDDCALDVCAEWMRHKDGGIVWTEHNLFARRLAERTGASYFGAEGRTDAGLYIEDAVRGSAVVASIDANREGKNLQGLWYRNLITTPPPVATWWEQVMGRTHRRGQESDEVTVDVLLGCRENYDAVMKAIERARVIRDTTGKVQKLLQASVNMPSEREIEAKKSARWTR